MTYFKTTEFLAEVEKGNVPGHSTFHKFGRNASVGTSFVPIASQGFYRTPQAASATALRVKAGGDANDTAAGSGARSINLQGLDETGALVNETIATAGASASSASTTTFMRLFRAYVVDSGTYGSATAGSHSGDIVIENSAGTEDWTTIFATDFPRGQSEIGAFTVPLGKSAYLYSYGMTSDSTKVFDWMFFKRESILDASAPYEAMRLQFEGVGILEQYNEHLGVPYKFPALTDIGIMAKVDTGTADMSAEFELLLVDNTYL